MPSRLPRLFACFAIFFLSSQLCAAGSTVERIGALSDPGVSDDLKKAVDDNGYRVTLDDGWIADFWFARALPTAPQDSPGTLYPELANGEFVAVANLKKGISDYRGQAVPPGIYTLRYQYLPQDASHMGVSPNPDFLLEIPAATDANPGEPLAFKRLVALSAKSTGTGHPAVLAMATAGTPASIAKEEGMTVLTVEVPSSTSGKKVKFGIILRGQATQ